MKRVVLIGIALGLLSGCGESGEEKAAAGFVSISEARSYFHVRDGSTSGCWPHERMDFVTWQMAGEPKEKVWGSVSCRIAYAYKSARAEHIYPGEVLTYGIP